MFIIISEETRTRLNSGADAKVHTQRCTPGLHNKIPAHKIFARVWVAQEPICYTINAKISRVWVRKDGNLVMETGCTAISSTGSSRTDIRRVDIPLALPLFAGLRPLEIRS